MTHDLTPYPQRPRCAGAGKRGCYYHATQRGCGYGTYQLRTSIHPRLCHIINFGDVLSRLTPIQASVLTGLADPAHPRLFSGEFMSANGVKNVGSVTRALNRLKDDELVYEFQGEWKFTNPFFREWLIRRA